MRLIVQSASTKVSWTGIDSKLGYIAGVTTAIYTVKNLAKNGTFK